MRRASVTAIAGRAAAGSRRRLAAFDQRAGGRPGAARARKVVLAWADTRNGSRAARVHVACAVGDRAAGYESGVYDTFIRTDSNIIARQPKKTTGEPASGGPSLAMADAIFFLGHRDVPIDEAQKKELLAFVRDDGKGLVAAHTALTAFDSWPEFGELLGGRYDGHPWHAPGTVINEGADFPATRHFPPTFAISRRVLSGQGLLAERRACCFGSTCRRCRRTPSCATATFRSRGRRPTARGACSIPRSRTTPPRGTTATSR